MSTLNEFAAMSSLPTLSVRVPGRDEETYVLERGMTIGRAPDNSIVIDHCDVCPTHARIWRDASRDGWNGLCIVCESDFELTLHSGNQVDQLPLENGVEFWIGEVKCAF